MKHLICHKMKSKIANGGRLKSLADERSFSIIDHKAYRFYLDNSKIQTRKDIGNYVEHGKILAELYNIIGEKIVESEGGVYINNLGYFGVVQAQKGKIYKVFHEKKLNPATDNIIYKIGFVPISKNNNLKPWVFDSSYYKSIKQSLKKALKSGKKYSFNASLFFNNILQKGNDL